MKRKIFVIVIAIFLFPLLANALSDSLKQKYPYTVLTDDYGILNAIDLDSELDGVKHPPVFSKKNSAYIYWQCFPRAAMEISLVDLGDSPEEDDEMDMKYNGENNAKLTVSVSLKRGVVHKYITIGSFTLTLTENLFNRCLKLIQGEKYVCLAGSYLEKKTIAFEGKKQRIYYWNFEKMKTNKGCEAYRTYSCHYDQESPYK